jgi:fructose-1,6-bisphosphatase/inositol monophosphatase family enzyme
MLDPETVASFIRETAQSLVVPRFRMLAREDIREKGPGDLVTIADIETERELTRRLETAAPGSAVLGEESVANDPARLGLVAGEAPLWIIDPVDGTANFARGDPGFAVIVAYAECAQVLGGWLYDPLNDVMVWATRGDGAWSAGRRLQVAAEVPPEHMVGAAYGRTAGGIRSAKALADSGRVGRIANRGCSGLEYLAIALGQAHFALHSRSLPWDHAAGMLIVAEAGGETAFLDGSPYDPRIPDRALLAAVSRQSWAAVRDVVEPPG